MVGSLKSDQSLRRWVYLALAGCCLLPVVFFLIVITKPAPEPAALDLAGRSPPPATADQHRSSGQPDALPPPREVSVWDDSPRQPSAPARTFAALQPTDPPPQPDPSMAIDGDPGEILGDLLAVNLNRMTSTQAEEVNQRLAQLRTMGPAAMPAIGEFLAGQQDINFDSIDGGTGVHYPSLRIALLDVLVEIGSPEAVAMIADSLQNVTDPLEIALVANELELQAPGQHRDEIMAAAHDALLQGMDGRDMTPVFEVLQVHGDETLVPLLEREVPRFNYYATMTLASLPDGAGIPSLVRLAKDPAITALGKGDYALRILAQTAAQYPAAWDGLAEQVAADAVPDTAWPSVASALAGNHLQIGNPLYDRSKSGAGRSTEQILRRISLIDQLLTVTANPVAVKELQRARTSLIVDMTR